MNKTTIYTNTAVGISGTTVTTPGWVTTTDLGSWSSIGYNDTSTSITDQMAEMIEFFDLVMIALGHDITFDKFKSMSSKERLALIRDIKIKRVIE